MALWRKSEEAAAGPGAVERRAIGLLLEGISVSQLQVHEDAYRRLRSGVLRASVTLSEPQAESEVLSSVSSIIRHFQNYRKESEDVLDEQRNCWQHLATTLLHRLANELRIDLEVDAWRDFSARLSAAVTSEQIAEVRSNLLTLIHHHQPVGGHGKQEEEEEQDRSTSNDNAAGLRGGGAALEHLGRMLGSHRPGYVAFFRLSCLDVIGERFGNEGMQDCLMTVASFLTQNLRREDTVYYWSESSLLAVCDRKVREEMIAAELNRVLARNRDFTLQVGEHDIMLRIPIELQLYPVSQFGSVDDLLRLAQTRSRERLLQGKH